MNNEKQRITIAKACGWRVKRRDITGYNVWEPDAEFPAQLSNNIENKLPDYLKDLNAMQSAENTLSVRDKQDYISILRNICTVAGCWPETATAAQRARAFLETLNLFWEDDK